MPVKLAERMRMPVEAQNDPPGRPTEHARGRKPAAARTKFSHRRGGGIGCRWFDVLDFRR